MGVSARSVASAKRVIASGTPELVQAVEEGKLKGRRRKKWPACRNNSNRRRFNGGRRRRRQRKSGDQEKGASETNLQHASRLTLERSLDNGYQISLMLYKFFGFDLALEINNELTKLFDALTTRQPVPSLPE